MRVWLIGLVVCSCGAQPAAEVDARPRDAGSMNRSEPSDGGSAPDAAIRSTVDAGSSTEAEADAGGSLDAGAPLDAGTSTQPELDAGHDGGEPDAGALTLDAGAVTHDAGAPPSLDAGASDAGAGRPPIEGFGRATRGGWQPGHDEVLVTSLSNDGPGSLREALDSAMGPRVIRFAQSGIIALQQPLLVPSNVSIDGRGRQVTLTGKGLILAGSDEVIVMNLAIQDVAPSSEDGLRIGDPSGPSERVVIDHVTFRASTQRAGDSATVDEAISIVFGSRDITLSWLRVEGWEKFLLIGNGDAPATVDGAISVSMHHVYTSATGRRHPQARHGIVDVWNCFFDDWRMFDWAFLAPYRESFGVQAQDGARVRVENGLVRRATHSRDVGSQANHATRCESGGRIDTVNVQVAPGSTAPLQFGVGCSGSTGWTRPYPVTLELPDAQLLHRLTQQAGNTL